jgi:hypothetical protein
MRQKNYYVATMSDPGKMYLGVYEDRELTTFNGKSGYWVVWDAGVMNAARMVPDNNGRPKGFHPRILSNGFVYGYVKDR